MKFRGFGALLGSAGLMVFAASGVLAGEVTALKGTAGDGFIFADPAEQIDPPGLKIVTGAVNNDDFTSANGFAPNGVLNCFMANAPADIDCAAAAGSGKRIKVNLTGTTAFDESFAVAPTGGITEYFTFGKVTNQTGARILGFELQLGTGTGASFAAMDPSDPATAALFDQLVPLSERASEWPGLGGETTGQNPLQRAFFPDGLFGGGGQEGEIGFFDGESAGFVLIQDDTRTLISGTELFNDVHLATFGTGVLPRNMIPDAYFWDDNGNPDDESALVGWFNPSANSGAGAWLYGTLGIDDAGTVGVDELEDRLLELAAAVGVTDVGLDGIADDLGYAPGSAIPAEVLAAMRADDIFAIDVIEDLSNLNLNYSIDVGDLAGGQFTLRLVPIFAPIVTVADTALQFGVAASLDAANIPFLGADPALLDIADAILALPTPADQQRALERAGFSFAGAYGELAYAMGRSQFEGVFARGDLSPAPQAQAGLDAPATASLAHGGDGIEGATFAFASQNADGAWALGEKLTAFVSGGASTGDRDATANGAGFDVTTWNVTAGLDYALSETLAIGLAGGYTGAEADIDDGRGTLDADGFAAMLYAKARIGAGGWLDGAAGYQWLDYESTRNIVFGGVAEQADGDTEGGQFFIGARGGWDFRTGALTYGPVARAELTLSDIDGFTETGSVLAMSVDDQDSTVFHGALGVRVAYDVAQDWGSVRPHARIGVAGRTGDDDSVLTAFGGIPGFATPVDGGDDLWLDLGAGLSAVVYEGASISARVGIDYQGALFGSDYTEHRGMLGLTISF